MDYAIDYIHIPQFKIKSCLGCFQCIKKGQCVIQDDTFTIVDRLQKADGIIIASPIFVYTVSGLLKNFFDRTILMIHRPVLVGKPSLMARNGNGFSIKANERVYGKGEQLVGALIRSDSLEEVVKIFRLKCKKRN